MGSRGAIPPSLIDPATGAPAAEYWRTVSVAAGSCVDANIASCAAIILGPAAAEWLGAHQLPARLEAPGGRVTTVAGWPAEPAPAGRPHGARRRPHPEPEPRRRRRRPQVTAVLATNSRALWYLTRGFGLVALILLTVTMVLGLTEAVRYARPGWPRFVVSALHRNASLLAVVALTIHVVTSVLDTYAPIHLADVFLPFVSAYRPFWLGLGALALDLLLALVITSLLRERSGSPGLAGGPLDRLRLLAGRRDPRPRHRLGHQDRVGPGALRGVRGGRHPLRVVAAGAGAGRPPTPASGVWPWPPACCSRWRLAAWTITGPLQAGWARKSGTPTALLGVQTGASTASGSAGAHQIPGRLGRAFHL